MERIIKLKGFQIEYLIMALIIIFSAQNIYGVYIPTAQPVYGGRIEHTRAIPLSLTETRVFITTNSANSMFYADVTDVTTTPVYSAFQVVPDLDETANYGWLRNFAADEGSQFVFASVPGFGLMATDINAGNIYTVDANITEAVEIYESYLFYLQYNMSGVELFYGQVYDTSYGASCGDVHTTGSVVVTGGSMGGEFDPDIMINPDNECLYIFDYGTPPTFWKSSDPYYDINATTTFSNITVTDLAAVGMPYIAAGIAPDGRIIVGGYTGNSSSYNAYSAYSDADGEPWTTSTISQDTGRGEIRITQTSSTNYNVLFSRVYSVDNGVSWDWHGGADGTICFDPNNDDLAYVRTDWAMGACDISGTPTITDINDGIVAVQVNDFAMDITKEIAWVASKSGIWYVYDYTTSPVWVTTPLCPNDDSTIYVTATTSITGDSVYVGNSSGRAFKYESAYGSLSNGNFDSMFEATVEDPTWTYGTEVSSIALDFASPTERTFIGTYDEEDWDETTDSQGGIFVGEYSGSWSWSQITGSPLPSNGVDVNDIAVLYEGGATVAYTAVEYHYDATYGTGTSIYRLEDDGAGGWIITRDLEDIYGNGIYVTVFDLWVDSSQNLYACGIDAGWTTVVAYYKAYGTTYWEVLETSGLPTSLEGKSITVDEAAGTVYMAIENEVYELTTGATSWILGTSISEGNDIQFIYFDDLLIGTGTGLYSIEIDNSLLYPPANLMITTDVTTVYLSWDPSAGATSYTIYSDTDPYGSFTTIEDSGITSNYWDEPLSGDIKFYRITANN